MASHYNLEFFQSPITTASSSTKTRIGSARSLRRRSQSLQKLDAENRQNELQQTIVYLEDQLASTIQQKEDLEQRCREQKMSLDALQDVEARYEDIQAEIEQLRPNYDVTRIELDRRMELLTALRAEHSEATSQLVALTEEKQAIEARNTTLKRRLSDEVRTHDNTRKKLATLENSINGRETVWQKRFRSLRDDYDAKLNSARTRIQELEKSLVKNSQTALQTERELQCRIEAMETLLSSSQSADVWTSEIQQEQQDDDNTAMATASTSAVAGMSIVQKRTPLTLQDEWQMHSDGLIADSGRASAANSDSRANSRVGVMTDAPNNEADNEMQSLLLHLDNNNTNNNIENNRIQQSPSAPRRGIFRSMFKCVMMVANASTAVMFGVYFFFRTTYDVYKNLNDDMYPNHAPPRRRQN